MSLSPDEVEQRSLSNLRWDAGCAMPDDERSPGGLLLTRTRDRALLEWRNDGEDADADNFAEDMVSNSDRAMWEEFVDLEAWNEDVDGSHLNEMARDAMYRIAKRLAEFLITELQEWQEEQDEDNEDDEDDEDDEDEYPGRASNYPASEEW